MFFSSLSIHVSVPWWGTFWYKVTHNLMIEIQFHFTPIFRQGDIKFLQHYCFIDPTLYCTHMAIMGIYSTVFLTLAIHNVTLTLVSLDIDPAFLFWTCTWNIQWRWFLYLYILCGLLSCNSSPICKKCWSCLCIPLHTWWWFGMLYGLWDFFTP